MRQRNYSESLLRFNEIVRRYPSASLMDDAVFKIGEIHLFMNHFSEAIESFRFITDSMQLSILKDRAQFCIAEIHQVFLKNKSQAIEEFEKLLAQFPNSLYAEEARKRIRSLRGTISR